MFLKNGEGWTNCARMGWAGQALHYVSMHSAFSFPSKKSSLQKSSALNFVNLTLHAREARGVPQNQWFSLLAAKENHSENDLVPILVTLYNSARTYFSTNVD